MPSIAEQLLELEKKLLDPELRRTPEKLSPLLADDFLEFGSSGHSMDKKRVLYLLKKMNPAKTLIEEFRAVELNGAAALVTYRAVSESTRVERTRYSLRSSLWVVRNGGWQILFHQGTPVKEDLLWTR
ncbi:MAG TPA: DUF4440 domain-containing protein [Terriglobales bacterium]|nr:DUF4440 domain-containing protein [Terriglobales bacterium]